MMLPPNFAPRGSSSAVLCGYSPHGAGMDCQSCLDHRRQSSRPLVCLHITEHLQAGAVTMAELVAETVRRSCTEYEKKLAALQAQLDRELEWKPCESCGTNMSQDLYESLLASCTGDHGDPHVMSEDETRQLVAAELSFSPERIEIIATVHTYEVNKHRQLRVAATYTCQSLYDATDYNYLRFNVRGAGSTWTYEMVNGELETYVC